MGKDPADADIQINVLKEAYSVLSDNVRRAGYADPNRGRNS